MKILRLLAAAALALLGSACIYHRDHVYEEVHGVPPGHGGMPPGQARKHAHIHGHACGHVLIDGVWVVVGVDLPPGHRHR